MLNVELAKRRREELGLTLKDVALRMGVDASDLSRWENGVRTPRAHRIAAWADALGLEPGDFFAGQHSSGTGEGRKP